MFAKGGKHYDPKHIMYVISVTRTNLPQSQSLAGFVIVAATRWLRDWQVGRRIGIYAGVNDIQVEGQIRGIVKVENNQVFGAVPNVSIPFWTVK